MGVWITGFGSSLNQPGLLKDGWLPPVRYSGQWVRLLMDQVEKQAGQDPLYDAVSDAAYSVNLLEKAAAEAMGDPDGNPAP